MSKTLEDLEKENISLVKDLGDLKTKMSEFFKKQETNVPKTKEAEVDVSILEEAKKKASLEQERKELENEILQVASFNQYMLDSFKESDFFDDEVKQIFEVAKEKTYKNQTERANDIKISVFESVFGKQKNLEILPSSIQNKINGFFKFSSQKKNEVIKSYFEYIQIAKDIYEEKKKSEYNLKMREKGYVNDKTMEYEKRIFEIRNKKESQKNQ
ncbi:MAG: hypothetical protein LBF97_07830 [Elusimicrobiota bacterium]|jgi:hypothetical protein|nr:hypothetical protein [Elusimicrobiota bacterium]